MTSEMERTLKPEILSVSAHSLMCIPTWAKFLELLSTEEK